MRIQYTRSYQIKSMSLIQMHDAPFALLSNYSSKWLCVGISVTYCMFLTFRDLLTLQGSSWDIYSYYMCCNCSVCLVCKICVWSLSNCFCDAVLLSKCLRVLPSRRCPHWGRVRSLLAGGRGRSHCCFSPTGGCLWKTQRHTTDMRR